MNLKIKASIFFLLGVACLTFAAKNVFATTTMRVIPSEAIYEVGDLFTVTVVVDADTQPINAASAELHFDSDRLEVTNLGVTQSIFSMSTDEPTTTNKTGIINFSGGMTSPGFQGTEGQLVRITFKVKKIGRAAIAFDSGAILANDGMGTNILDQTRGGSYTLTPSSRVVNSTGDITFFDSANIVYISILVILLTIALLTIAILAWLSWRRKQMRKGLEMREAQHKLHKNFDELRNGFRQFVRYIMSGKAKKTILIADTEQAIEEELDAVEDDIQKQIEDLK